MKQTEKPQESKLFCKDKRIQAKRMSDAISIENQIEPKILEQTPRNFGAN